MPLDEILLESLKLLRRDIHANPELLFDVNRTANLVEARLQAAGCDEVHSGIGKTGVVGIIRGRTNNSGKVIGLRADMDALPIHETTNLPYSSRSEGKMHACGHDGHTTMLLGAAQVLAESRNFDGTVVVIFQPAEEGASGAKAMIEDGLFTRFGIQEVYGMHNAPGVPVGQFRLRAGSAMSAADRFEVTVEGRGGHAARPHQAVDPVMAATQIINALQTIVSRGVDPLSMAVVSVCAIHGGDAFNVIPQDVMFRGTVRTLDPQVQDTCEQRLREVVENTARSCGATARVMYNRDVPSTYNDPDRALSAGDAAAAVVGEEHVDRDMPPALGSEDFSYMLQERPGAFVFMGNGDSAGLHHPMYNFNDEAIPYGVSYWQALVENRLS